MLWKLGHVWKLLVIYNKWTQTEAQEGVMYSCSGFSHLEHWGHEDRTTHEDKDHEPGDALLSDAQELGLLSGSGAAGLHLQAVHVGDGEDGRSHEPRQAHNGAHTQHDCHDQQVQVIATAFLLDTQGNKREVRDARAAMSVCPCGANLQQ